MSSDVRFPRYPKDTFEFALVLLHDVRRCQKVAGSIYLDFHVYDFLVYLSRDIIDRMLLIDS